MICMLVCKFNFVQELPFLIVSLNFSLCLEINQRNFLQLYEFPFPLEVLSLLHTKPTACQVVVGNLITSHSLYSLTYANTSKQLTSLPSCHFGQRNHICNQSWRL